MSEHTLAEWKSHEADLRVALVDIDITEPVGSMSGEEYERFLFKALEYAQRKIAHIEAQVLTEKSK